MWCSMHAPNPGILEGGGVRRSRHFCLESQGYKGLKKPNQPPKKIKDNFVVFLSVSVKWH